MVTLLKLGGSLITDKTQREILREDVLARLANEIAQALGANPTMQLVIGHGSGSFANRASTSSRNISRCVLSVMREPPSLSNVTIN
ncbi:MAG: hypothetical protein AAFQ52_13445 [Chloroflexota bacterium]